MVWLALFLNLFAFGTQSLLEAYDLREGSCEEFNDEVKNRGLHDPEGNTHLNTLGWTVCKFNVETAKLPIQKEGNCLKGDVSSAKFSSEQTVIIMRWDHRRYSITQACRLDLAKKEQAIRSHEAHHVEDCKAIAESANKSWDKSETHIVKVCSQPANLITKTLKSRMHDELQGQLNKMGRDMEYRSRATHERIGYGTSGLDCWVCGAQN